MSVPTTPTEMDSVSVPLPSSDNTVYFASSPSKYPVETPQAVRQIRSSRNQARANIFDTETPVVSTAFNLFQTPHGDDQETPRARPTRGGKYIPGYGLKDTPTHRASNPGSDVKDSPKSSSGNESEGPGPVNWVNGMESDDSVESEGEMDEHEDMDQTIAINLGSSVAQQLGVPTRSHRINDLSSPGRTPARKMAALPAGFTPSLSEAFGMQETPRATASTNQPLFADFPKTPFLSAPSARKLNAMQRLAPNTPPSLSYEALLKEKEEEVIQLKQLLAGTPHGAHSYADFINFSPEKQQMEELPENLQLTVTKRRSPRKKTLSATASPNVNTSSRGFRSSPIKSMALFDGIIKPVTVEERKRAKRRRVTQEFRDFSAIDYTALKGFLTPSVPELHDAIEEEELPQSRPQDTLSEEVGVRSRLSAVMEEDQVVEYEMKPETEKLETETEILEAKKPETEKPELESNQEEPEEKPEPEAQEARPEIQAEAVVNTETDAAEEVSTEVDGLTIPPLDRSRGYRSSSAPPVPRPEDAEATKLLAVAMDLDHAQESEIAQLKQTIAELNEKLETTDVLVDRLRAELMAERQMRVAAQDAREFLELERKFGVCCSYNPASKPAKEKLGPAAIQLPNSPPTHAPITETRGPQIRRPTAAPKSRLNRPASRLGDRPASRIGDRPASRIGSERAADKPPTRMGASNSYAKNTTAPVINRKRPREEPPAAPGRPAARPEKRVLSSVPAQNIILGSSANTSSLHKKPEKVVGRSLRSTGGAAASSKPGALARGARR